MDDIPEPEHDPVLDAWIVGAIALFGLLCFALGLIF